MQTDSAAIRTLLQVYQDLYRARDAVRALTERDWRYVLEVELDVAGGRGGFALPGPRLSTRSPERG